MLYNLRHIRKYLDQKSAETLVHTFSTRRLDYCNSLLHVVRLPESQIIILPYYSTFKNTFTPLLKTGLR